MAHDNYNLVLNKKEEKKRGSLAVISTYVQVGRQNVKR